MAQATLRVFVMPVVFFILLVCTLLLEKSSTTTYIRCTLSWVVLCRFLCGVLTISLDHHCAGTESHWSGFTALRLPVLHTAATELFNAWYSITKLESGSDSIDITAARRVLLAVIFMAVLAVFVIHHAVDQTRRVNGGICTTAHLVALALYIQTDMHGCYTLGFMCTEFGISILTARIGYTSAESWSALLMGLHCWFPYHNPVFAMYINMHYPRVFPQPMKDFVKTTRVQRIPALNCRDTAAQAAARLHNAAWDTETTIAVVSGERRERWTQIPDGGCTCRQTDTFLVPDGFTVSRNPREGFEREYRNGTGHYARYAVDCNSGTQ
jgi:hypothetical protein